VYLYDALNVFICVRLFSARQESLPRARFAGASEVSLFIVQVLSLYVRCLQSPPFVRFLARSPRWANMFLAYLSFVKSKEDFEAILGGFCA
jgi:hypothetical protein